MATVNYMKQLTQSSGALRAIINYVMQEHKTAPELISGINCSAQNPFRDFITTKNAFGKNSGTMFYHYVQSFHPNENLTPQQIHEVGKVYAAKVFAGHEVLMATHIDTQARHNHFVVNSVSFETGKKLHYTPNSLIDLRAKNDEVCRDFGLKVLKTYEKANTHGMNNREYRAGLRGNSWIARLGAVIDRTMDWSRTKGEFIVLIQQQGYAVRWENNRKNITYTAPNGMKCRDIKLHETKYLKGNMEDEFSIREKAYAERNARIERPGAGNAEQAVSADSLRNSGGAMGSDAVADAVGGTIPTTNERNGGDACEQSRAFGVCRGNPIHGNRGANQADELADNQSDGKAGQCDEFAEYSEVGYRTGWEESRTVLGANIGQHQLQNFGLQRQSQITKNNDYYGNVGFGSSIGTGIGLGLVAGVAVIGNGNESTDPEEAKREAEAQQSVAEWRAFLNIATETLKFIADRNETANNAVEKDEYEVDYEGDYFEITM